MKKKISFASLILSLALPFLKCQAQEEYAVVNKSIETVNIESHNSYTYKKHIEILIKDEKAEALADFNLSTNGFTKLVKMDCTISTPEGVILQKYKKSDIKQTEYSTELASDEVMKYLDTDLPRYPVVVTYDVEVQNSGNVLLYPAFYPVTGYCLGLKEASYSLTIPEDFEIKYSQLYSQLKPTETIDAKGRKVITFEVKDLKPVKQEGYAKPLDTFVPAVYFTPAKIEYFKTTASMESWQEFGKWIWGLTESQNILPDDVKAKVHSLADGLTTNHDKIAALYKYLGESTRYASIQLGIGGFKPLDPIFVCKNGIGDCKALTNLMKLMLREIGIESVYTIISTEEARLVKESPNFMQMDHVILKVPDGDKDLWLECTNPKLPLGYVHKGIAGHDAIEITADGGKFVTLPEYGFDMNCNNSEMKMKLHEDGKADISFVDSYEYHLYNDLRSLATASQKDRKDAITVMYNLPFADLKTVEITDNSKPFETPNITIKTEATGVKIANISGSRLFVTMNPMHSNAGKSDLAENREHELFIERGKVVTESVELEIPEDMTVESSLQLPNCTNEVGTFLAQSIKDGNKIKIETTLAIHKGTYSKEKAALLDELINASRSVYSLKLILKKNKY